MAERQFKKVAEADFIKLGETEIDGAIVSSVEGTVVSKEQIAMRNGLVGKYQLRPDDGAPFSFLGATKLDELMANVSVGDYCRVTLLPEKQRTSSGNEMKQYEVEIGE